AYELGGLRVTDDPDRSDPYVFPDGARIMPGGFLVLRARETGLELSGVKVRVFLLSETGFVLSAAAFDQELPGALPAVGFSDARFPDGGRPGWLTRTPTPAAPNEVARLTDLVINEIFYQPPEDRRGEFLELYHRGTEPLDISGFRFTKGIAYTFPEGTVVQPGEYVVLTEDPGILLENHGVDAHRYEGQLADGGENIRLVDRLGNVVDEVRYHDGGEWSRWSDGDGSSLELIDPRQENDFPTAWTDSDESEKTRWEELSYEVPRYAPAGESELHLFLAGKGVCRIDDVAVIRESDGSNLVANSGFEEDTRPWRIEGTHVDSHRITSDRHSGEACLELVATGKGDSGCNRLETDVARLGRESLTVSLWARWLRGASLLIAHGEFAAGRWPGTRDVNLSNNSLGRRLRLTVPVDLGTPGRENSARALLRETGDDNLGPVMADARHVPTSPAAGEPVTVVARIADADGVERAEILYKLDDGTLEGFQSAELFDDGAHEDGRPGDGLYGGTIPGFPLRSHVIYTIQATDTAGSTGRLPSRAPEESFVYAVEGRVAEQIQVVLDRASDRELRTRRLHSNDLVDGTFVYDGEDVYYNVGLRYRGSPWGRPQMQSYRVTFPKDRLLHRNRRQINISNRDRNDGLAYFLIGRNGTTRTPAPVSDYEYIRTRVNGRSFGTPGVFNPVNRDFVEMWYGDEAADGAVVLKAVGRLRFSDACQRTGWDEAHLQHMETNPENYRFYWFHSIHQSRDNWEPFYELTRLLDRRHTADAEFDRRVAEVVDLDAFFQVLGPRILMSDGDALFVGNGHNGYVLWDPTDRRWKLLAFDFGGAFRNSGANILGVRDAGVRRLLTRPVSQRVYFRTLLESLEGYWSVEKAGPWLEAMQRAAGLGASVRNFLASSSRAAQSALRRHVQVEFRILTNDGMDFTHPEPSVELEGESPIQVAWIFFRRGDGEFELLEPTWTRATRWRATFDVPADANRFEFVGIGGDGDEIASASIAVLRNASFLRGDATGDGRLNVSDPVATLFFLFRGRALRCPDAADVDDSGDVNLTDAVRLLSFLFRGGPPPQEPFPVAGADPTEDELSCQDG
ncbi:MAG: lamin tail domain-containing protein, partial [Planctomycetota bacterium]|nr:lamin tail domain-containing protein [Planctomycetota bacterium]